MDSISQFGLALSLQERAEELNNLAFRATENENNAEFVAQAIDIIDNKRYSYLYELLKTKGGDK